MNVFFKIEKDGKSVRVAKTFISSKIDSDEFSKKAKKISVEKFLEPFTGELRRMLEKAVKTVEEIHNMKLGQLGVLVDEAPNRPLNEIYYCVGDQVFCDYIYDDKKESIKNKAIKYGEDFFGESFMNKNKKLLEKSGIHYYFNQKEISEKEYDSQKKIFNRLTEIFNVKDIEKNIYKGNKRK